MSASPPTDSNRFYLAAWRWHFYAGLFVVPFLLVLATTGLVMLLSQPIDTALHRDWLRVTPAGVPLSPEEQVRNVVAAHPSVTVAMYIAPQEPDRSAQVSIVSGHAPAAHENHAHGGHAGHSAGPASAQPASDTVTVYVDPYSGRVLGSQNLRRTAYGWATVIHGTLLMGTVGDLLIEIAAGFGVLLIATGLFLWWPRAGEGPVFRPQVLGRRRLGWRDLHSAIGFWCSCFLAFFLLSGLAWTLIWGGRIVQGFNSLPPAEMQSPGAALTHASLNQGALRQVPWVLEQTPMPSSGTPTGLPGIAEGTPVSLNAVVEFARDNGFTGYRVNFPRDSLGVWTVAAATMSRDIADPRRDRTLHLDQYTGRILADYRFPDYPLLGKAMAAGIALHQGNLGPINLVANVFFCLAVITLCVSGGVMWWMRRPAGVRRLVPPPMPKDVRAWRRAAVLMFAISLAFPLVAITLAFVAILDFGVVSRVPALRAALK